MIDVISRAVSAVPIRAPIGADIRASAVNRGLVVSGAGSALDSACWTT
eukprot:XP_001704481.1 Hypothetical protein GL50803_32541 [Giardia lamblia ATCC 50803]